VLRRVLDPDPSGSDTDCRGNSRPSGNVTGAGGLGGISFVLVSNAIKFNPINAAL